MNRIVREECPAAELPEDLRPPGAKAVRVTVEVLSDRPGVESGVPTLDELWAMRRPPFKTIEQILEQVREDRDEWDD